MPTLDYYKRILSAYVFKKTTSNLSFWHTRLDVNKLSDEDRGSVKRYPMNFSEKTKYNLHKDSNGVIMLDYGGKTGLQYNPNAIAQLALGFYDLYLSSIVTGTEEEQGARLKDFLSQAQFFTSHGRAVSDNILLWEYNFPFENREYIKSPWRSALAQGQAISVALRAYILTQNEQYLQAAVQGFNSFRYSCMEHEGGVIFIDEGNVWLEELVLSKPNHILNGFVWALWGVRDYAVFFKDDYAQWLYESAENTLRNNIDAYDLKFWTCYDNPRSINGPVMPVSGYYQRLHYTQMLAMYELTHEKIYYDKYKLWLSYYDNKLYRSAALCWKACFKLLYW